MGPGISRFSGGGDDTVTLCTVFITLCFAIACCGGLDEFKVPILCFARRGCVLDLLVDSDAFVKVGAFTAGFVDIVFPTVGLGTWDFVSDVDFMTLFFSSVGFCKFFEGIVGFFVDVEARGTFGFEVVSCRFDVDT